MRGVRPGGTTQTPPRGGEAGLNHCGPQAGGETRRHTLQGGPAGSGSSGRTVTRGGIPRRTRPRVPAARCSQHVTSCRVQSPHAGLRGDGTGTRHGRAFRLLGHLQLHGGRGQRRAGQARGRTGPNPGPHPPPPPPRSSRLRPPPLRRLGTAGTIERGRCRG